MRFDPNYVSILTQAIGTSSAAEQKLTNELSSGLRVSKLSDDAVASSSNVLLSSSISRLDAFVASSSRAQSLLQTTDATLGEVVTQITSAVTLSVSASNGTLTSANLAAIGKQVADIRDNVLSLANTSYLGTYLFSGSVGSTRPFALDTSTMPSTTTYAGDEVVRNEQTPDGQQVPINVTGKSVFDAPGASLLGTLNQLVTDLASGDQTAVATDSSGLTAALGVVSQQRSTIGGSLARLAATTGYASGQQTLFTAAQSSLLSADPAEVATNLKTAEVQHQALLGVVSTVDKENLFDYMH